MTIDFMTALRSRARANERQARLSGRPLTTLEAAAPYTAIAETAAARNVAAENARLQERGQSLESEIAKDRIAAEKELQAQRVEAEKALQAERLKASKELEQMRIDEMQAERNALMGVADKQREQDLWMGVGAAGLKYGDSLLGGLGFGPSDRGASVGAPADTGGRLTTRADAWEYSSPGGTAYDRASPGASWGDVKGTIGKGLSLAGKGASIGGMFGGGPGAAAGATIGFVGGLIGSLFGGGEDTGSDGSGGDSGGGGGICIIVTTCTHRYSPEVNITREFRDRFLDPTTLKGYYAFARMLVPLLERFGWLKKATKRILVDRLIDFGEVALGYKEKWKYRTSGIMTAGFLAFCRSFGRRA